MKQDLKLFAVKISIVDSKLKEKTYHKEKKKKEDFHWNITSKVKELQTKY